MFNTTVIFKKDSDGYMKARIHETASAVTEPRKDVSNELKLPIPKEINKREKRRFNMWVRRCNTPCIAVCHLNLYFLIRISRSCTHISIIFSR